jgi:hypothetical protein
LEEKRQELERERAEKIKLRNENAELRKKVERLTQIARNTEGRQERQEHEGDRGLDMIR